MQETVGIFFCVYIYQDTHNQWERLNCNPEVRQQMADSTKEKEN